MKSFFIRWLINSLALFSVLSMISGVSADSWQTVIIAALVLGLLNAFLRPVLLLLTLPFNIATLGLFTLVINGFLFYLAAKFVRGFSVAGLWSAFWAAILFSVVSFMLNVLLGPKTIMCAASYASHGTGRIKDEDVIDVEGRVENEKQGREKSE